MEELFGKPGGGEGNPLAALQTMMLQIAVQTLTTAARMYIIKHVETEIANGNTSIVTPEQYAKLQEIKAHFNKNGDYDKFWASQPLQVESVISGWEKSEASKQKVGV